MRPLAAALGVGIVAAGALAFLVLRGTAGASFPSVELDASRARPQGDVYRSPTTEPTSLNPFTSQDAVVARTVWPFTHDALVDLDPLSGTVRPAAAESWTVSDDGLTVTFALRSDLVFADGSPVGRDDLAFTLQTSRDPRLPPNSQMAFVLAELGSATAPDDRTIVMKLVERRADPALALGAPVRIAQRRFFVEAARALDPAAADPTSDAFFEHLPEIVHCGPGIGPYAEQQVVLGSDGWIRGSHLNLVPNPHSWRRTAQPECWNLAGLQLRFVLDEASRLAAARTGQVDWFVSMAGGDLADLQERDPVLAERFVLYRYDPRHIGHYFVLWNCRKPPLDRPEVRRALGMLFDRERIAKEVFGGNASVAKGYFKPGMPEYPDDFEPPRFAPQEAGRILAALGFGREGTPLRVELLCVTELPALRRIAELAAAAFAEAGIELVVQPMEYGSMVDRQGRGDFDAILFLQQHEPVIDPYDYFASGQNDMGYESPEMDEVLLRARATQDPDERLALYHRFHEILRDDQPITLLVHPSVQVLLHRRFRDAAPGPLGLVPEHWWVPTEEQLVR